MKSNFDFNELINFGKRLTEYENFETTIMTATREIAKVLHRHLLNKSPIDTGNLRKWWSAGENLQFTVERKNGGYEVTIVNKGRNEYGYKYPWVVNYGHWSKSGNWVAGQFFVENSVIATKQVAEKIIRRELTKWFKRCLNGK